MKTKICLLLTIFVLLLTVLFIPSMVFAGETASGENIFEQASDYDLYSLPVIYTVKSKTFVSNISKVFEKDWTPSWSKASSYKLLQGWSHTSTITINAAAEILNGVKTQGSFVNSRTYTCSVTTTIPADSSRFSKLAHYRDYKKYNAVIQCTAGVNPPYVVGTYVVKEPNVNSYNIVRYQ